MFRTENRFLRFTEDRDDLLATKKNEFSAGGIGYCGPEKK
jgi:hypothetical protein